VTPVDKWTDDRLDDLAAQMRAIASVATLVATHEVKIDGQSAEVKALREAQRDALKEFREVLQKFDDACEDRVRSLALRIEEQTRARQWTPQVKAAILGPTFASLIAALALVIRGT
jgi:ElaB/YqjD/DUF883 family membrane-anchored ribosome-binding protein